MSDGSGKAMIPLVQPLLRPLPAADRAAHAQRSPTLGPEPDAIPRCRFAEAVAEV
jgi:hypothetical protein